MADFNFNDPDTWPDDIDDSMIEELASADETSKEQEVVEEQPDTKPDVTSEATEEPKEPEQAEEQAAEPDPTPDSSEEAEPLEIDGIPVLTKDGEHVIPHHVLQSARTTANEQKQRVAELEQQLAATRAATPPVAAQPEPVIPVEPEVFAMTDEQKAQVEKTREDWDDVQANLLAKSFKQDWVNQQLQNELQRISQVEAKQSQYQQIQADREQAEIDAAIAASPAMAAWEADKGGSEWFNKSAELHQFLMKSDGAYASKSFAEQFQELPSRVKAVYQDAPLPVAVKDIAAKAAEKAKTAQAGAPTAPTSLSEIGGEPELEKTEHQKLEDLSSADLQNKVMDMTDAEIEKLLAAV